MDWLPKFMNKSANDNAPEQPASAAKSEPTLDQSIRSHFVPTLREHGFAGSGRAFQSLSDDMILAVQIQGSKWGGSFAINLGIHPACIPVPGDIPQKKMKPYLCILSRRLSVGDGDQWWEHGSTAESMDTAVMEATSVYIDFGRPAFAKLTAPTSPLRTVTPEQFIDGQFDFSGFKSTSLMMAKMLALTRLAAGDSEGAQAFARIALGRVGPATGQIRELRTIDEGTWRKEDW